MGSMLSHMSFEWAIAAGIAGAMVYGYTTYSKGDPGAPATAPIGGEVAKGKKKKKKIQTPKTGISELSEKAVSTTASTSTTTVATTPTTQGNLVPEHEPIVVPFPHVIMPGEFGAVVPTLDDQGAHATQNKGKRKKQKQKKQEKGAPHDIDNAPEQLASYSGGDAAAPGSSGKTTIDIDMSSKSLKEEEEDLRIRSSSPSFDTDSSWTRIDHHQGTARPRGTKLKAAATGLGDRGLAITTDLTAESDACPSTGDSSIADRMDEDTSADAATITSTGDNQNNRRTLAEKLLPKPRKTAVDDMLERPDYPGLARVMRVHPRADETPAPGFSWKDYEDVDDGSGTLNDGENGVGEWGIVKGKSRSTSKDATTSSSQVVQKAPEQLTQKQRQNARRNQLAKAAKADAEAERLAKLAERKRVMERERIIEQSRRGASRATVDSRGKLVYD